jgi:hypothetical protein
MIATDSSKYCVVVQKLDIVGDCMYILVALEVHNVGAGTEQSLELKYRLQRPHHHLVQL